MGQRYAVLISSSRAPFMEEFFFDVVNMRQSLLNYGFAANNIFVLYGDGNDLADAAYPAAKYNLAPAIANMAAEITNVQQIFTDLSAGTNGFPQVTNQDLLFVYTFDHGGDEEPPGTPISTLCLNDGNMRADDFAKAVDQVNYAYRVFCMQQCFSGGFIPHLRNDRTVILTAADDNETASPADTEREIIADPVLGNVVYPHGEFNWHLFAALDGQSLDGVGVNADADGNTFLTMREVFDYIAGIESTWETPQYDDGNRDIGEKLRLNTVALMDIRFIIERSTFGEDEISARRVGNSAIVPNAFRVVVDGFNAADIGLTGSDSILPNLPWLTGGGGITIKPQGNTSSNGDYGPEEQRFTFHYDLDFGPNNDVFDFLGDSRLITLEVDFATFSASAQLELIKQPNPFILHGDPPYLSIDLRTFVVRANETKFGVTMGNAASDAPQFIQQVMKALTDGKGVAGGQSFDADLPLAQEASALYLQPTDGSEKVFNFALAKVRYIGTRGADDVRVFFRLLSTQSTSTAYDIPSGTNYPMMGSYRFWSDGKFGGKKIPLAGIGTGDKSNEYVTIPCFALPRVDSATTSMTDQLDSRTDASGNIFGNVQKITPNSDGSEVDTFFGCWLDTNQPTNKVLPINVVAGNEDGPFSAADDPRSIQEAIIRNGHQCLIAEIAFDPVEIPVGKDPSNWDKLAQRNIAWSPIGSAQAVSTFEIRPTPAATIQSGQMPDELMIDWGNTPRESLATIYLPAVKVADVLAMADQMYTTHQLEQVDDHTLQCPIGGITYIPIPTGTDINYAGLLSVDLPERLDPRQAFNIIVRQITNAFGQHPPEPPQIAISSNAPAATAIVLPDMTWRTVLGAFQLTIPVKTKAELLESEARQLSVLRWIQEAIPPDNRWYAVFNQYVGKIANRVDAFGGDSSQGEASPTGDWQKVRLCRTLAILCAVSLAVFLVALGIMTNWVAVAVIAVFLAAIAFTWVIQCQPQICNKLRVVAAGAGIGALILSILVLLGASSSQLVPVLCGAVALTVIAAVTGRSLKCF